MRQEQVRDTTSFPEKFAPTLVNEVFHPHAKRPLRWRWSAFLL